MDEAGIPYVLQSERMGYEVPGIRGVYSHVSPAMRAGLMANLEERWQTALAERGRTAPRSSVRPTAEDHLASPTRAKASAYTLVPPAGLGWGHKRGIGRSATDRLFP
jgi:hypothetical protein